MLYIQDPNYTESYSLHEALIEVCTKSNSGKGAYAFVTKTGADLLLGDDEFNKMLDRGAYNLIVGIDEITNTQTVERLNELQEQHNTLSIKAFLHNSRNSLFHPKISYFKKEDGGGNLVVGSGNLTASGLRKNREAFGVIDLSQREYINIDNYWSEWLTQSESYLKTLDDESVLLRVAENEFRARNRQEFPVTPEQPIIADDEQNLDQDITEAREWCYQEANLVLFAEIPRSGNRWNQANFDMNTFQTFFGATPGDNSQRIILRNVISDNNLSDIEIRPSVSVRSQNYRFELEAAAGIDYPREGRPIGVFIRLSTRMFIYKIFMPTHLKHAEIEDWMNINWNGRADRMKRIVKEAGDVQNILENTALDSFLD